MTWKIALFKIYRDEEDVEVVTEAIKAGMILGCFSKYNKVDCGYKRVELRKLWNNQ